MNCSKCGKQMQICTYVLYCSDCKISKDFAGHTEPSRDPYPDFVCENGSCKVKKSKTTKKDVIITSFLCFYTLTPVYTMFVSPMIKMAEILVS